ncbi:MAG TPA: lytic transglycosylase [Nocardioides bacterium]|uniref:transglycosylase SLT domain-containing protein n=1 Tax=uncultured Nocardioides sp. TaxID=198441 RepID=UPI000ED425D5|nr:transglycosylase SLT domain-containing protein [uncultured Nocardioides sp.]HCB04016.1 lytic transglycosylase [Nocardioides sp.]
MSVSDVTSRISQIQSQLALLTPSASSTSGSSFASALDGALKTSATTTSMGTADSSITGRDKVVQEARKYLGIPYLWGGTDPEKGLDCSGLVQLVYGNLGIDLPRVSRDQAKVGTAVPSLDDAQPGDLLAFGSPVHHIAIYIGGGKMIEAPRTGLDVRVTDVYETPTAIRRVLPDPSTSATTGVTGGTGGTGRASTSVGEVPYADLFNKAASTYGVDANLLAAMAKQESGFDPNAVSSAGAQGLMQLMPGTADALGVTNSFDPQQAVDGAARLMDDLLDRFGSTQLALAAYNAGPGAVMRYDGIPPYPETQNYVRSIMAMLGGN